MQISVTIFTCAQKNINTTSNNHRLGSACEGYAWFVSLRLYNCRACVCNSSWSLYSSSLQWINAKVNGHTALDRSTVQVFNGSTPRSMDTQLSLYSSTTPRRNTDLSQWPEDFNTRQQQTRTGNVLITSSHARFWLDSAPAMHELHVIPLTK